MYHSIHYVDEIRFIVGQPPEYFLPMARNFPGYTRGLVHHNHNNVSGQDDWCATYRFEGTKGVVKGTMGELLRAVEEDREPGNSVQDNLYTMQTAFAAYRSMEDNRPVTLQEIASEA